MRPAAARPPIIQSLALLQVQVKRPAWALALALALLQVQAWALAPALLKVQLQAWALALLPTSVPQEGLANLCRDLRPVGCLKLPAVHFLPFFASNVAFLSLIYR